MFRYFFKYGELQYPPFIKNTEIAKKVFIQYNEYEL